MGNGWSGDQGIDRLVVVGLLGVQCDREHCGNKEESTVQKRFSLLQGKKMLSVTAGLLPVTTSHAVPLVVA